MAKPPPTAVRYFVLIAAVALLATAVCSKTEKATSPSPTDPAPAVTTPADPTPVVVQPDESMDAGVDEATMQQAAEPPPAANPPANAAGKENSKGNRAPDKTVFPATKSGGMF